MAGQEGFHGLKDGLVRISLPFVPRLDSLGGADRIVEPIL